MAMPILRMYIVVQTVGSVQLKAILTNLPSVIVHACTEPWGAHSPNQF